MNLYPLSDMPTRQEMANVGGPQLRFEGRSFRFMAEKTGEFRAPKVGEWILGEATSETYNQEAYRATSDLTPGKGYYILKIVLTEAVTEVRKVNQ